MKCKMTSEDDRSRVFSAFEANEDWEAVARAPWIVEKNCLQNAIEQTRNSL